MPENQTVEILFSSLKDDMHSNFTNLTLQIEKLKDSIEHYQEKTNMSQSDIKVINEKISTLDKRLIENFKQHTQFYDNFKGLDRFVYKITGGIILAGVIVTVLLKLLKVL